MQEQGPFSSGQCNTVFKFYNACVTTRVKICGLTRQEDAEWALECGADALGFVFQPESKRYVVGTEGVDVPARLGPFALCVAVLGVVPANLKLGAGFSAAQGEGAGSASAPHRIEAIRLGGGRPVERVPTGATALLLDAYDPNAYGGTGKTVDWSLAAELVASSPLPVILAGGLTPDNVAEAIRIVRPYAVDVCSGVEASYGVKDKSKVRDFIQSAKTAL